MFQIKPFRKTANLVSMACLTIMLFFGIFTGWKTVFINASSASTIDVAEEGKMDVAEEGKTDGTKRKEITPASGTQSAQQKIRENSNSKPTDQAAKPKPQTREDFEKKFWQWASSYFEPKSNSGSDNPTYLPIILAIMIALFAIVFASHSAVERYSTGDKLNLPLCVLFCISSLGLFNVLITVNLDQDLYKSALSASNEQLEGLLPKLGNSIPTKKDSRAINEQNSNNGCDTQSCVIGKIKSLKKDKEDNSQFFDAWIDEIIQHATIKACGKDCNSAYDNKKTIFKDITFAIDGIWRKKAPDEETAKNWADAMKARYRKVHTDVCTVDATSLTELELNIAHKFFWELEKKITDFECSDLNTRIENAVGTISNSSDESRINDVINRISTIKNTNDLLRQSSINPKEFRKAINLSKKVYEEGAILVNRNISKNTNEQDISKKTKEQGATLVEHTSNKLSSPEIDAAEMTGNLANPATMLPFLVDTILSANLKIILITTLSLAIAVTFDWYYVGGITHLLSLYFKSVNDSASLIKTPNILKISSTRDNPGRGM